ncbi:hypothetical protein RGQ15_14480 [Paracoccus sp. MBLB3053]|uniref:Uncharacterized protein n=1 Tax=Paracoccus aurantius TaxID=3073814 RepID=A0ABU2HWT7_9RHOB|nr:hypothetical protein [Paracoccus sp. MBLB3053]MDS9468769.1 hypothetical protein [Paracoccus sp. MBLB3053]
MIAPEAQCNVYGPGLDQGCAFAQTSRREAVMLAQFHRAGELTAIWMPEAEVWRCVLARARSTAMRAAAKVHPHLQGFQLRDNRIYRGKQGRIGAYRRWLAMRSVSALSQQRPQAGFLPSSTSGQASILASTASR